MADSPHPRPLAPGLTWIAWAILLIAAFTRALVSFDPMPHWALDAARIDLPMTGIGPAGSVLLDTLMLAAAGIALLADSRRRAPSLAMTGLWALGSLGALLHMPGSLENTRLGLTWIAALAAGLALHHLCRDDRFRRPTLAAAVGLIGMLAAKGLAQVYIEHADTVAAFNQNRDAFLAARGWSSDSAMARAFVNRLLQPEATGWFGLANVYASFAAGATVALLGLVLLGVGATRRRLLPDGMLGLVILGLILASVALWLAHSKAGFAVAAVGAGLTALGLYSAKARGAGVPAVAAASPPPTSSSSGATARPRSNEPRPGTSTRLPLLLTALVLSLAPLAILARALVGERLGELSLLFRSFYARGALRIIADHPLHGVGPAGFKDAYMLVKPSIAPENVDSPHMLLLDYPAALGLFALPWLGLIARWIHSCANQLLGGPAPSEARRQPPPPDAAESLRPTLWTLLTLTAIPTLISGALEAGATTPESALARLVGIAAWIAISLGILAVTRIAPAWPMAFAAGALAITIHANLDVTPTWPGSAAWLFVLLAAHPATGRPPVPPGIRTRPALARASLPGLTLLLTALGAVLLALLPITRWQSHTADAAAAVRPLALLHARLDELPATGPAGEDSMARIAGDLGVALGVPAPTDPRSFEAAMAQLARRLLPTAIDELERARALYPRHEPTLGAISRACLTLASLETEPESVRRAAEAGETAAAEAARLNPGSASAHAWLGTARAARAEIEGDHAHLLRAVEAWMRAAALDPHGPTFPFQIARALASAGRRDEAGPWAARALANDANTRLDPLSGLSEGQRTEMEGLSRTP